jgi:hypothetical protein
MKKSLITILTLLSASLTLPAQEDIRVDRVDFNSLRDDWIQMEIELSCEGNSAEEARDKDYVEKIKVKAYLGYTRDASTRSFDYYTSEVEILIMEKGDDNNVYFYLPGLIVERDQLKTDPDFYYVEVTVNGNAQKPQKVAMSSNIPNLDILNSLFPKPMQKVWATNTSLCRFISLAELILDELVNCLLPPSRGAQLIVNLNAI